MFRRTCGDYARALFLFACEAMGAVGTRLSLRPPFSAPRIACTTRAHSRRGDVDVCVCRLCERQRSNPYRGPEKEWIASVALASRNDCGSDGLFEILVRQLAPRRARTGTVGEAGVAGAIGQAFDRCVAAKAEILRSGRADRPAASLLAQLEQRAAMFLADRVIVKEYFGLGVHRLQHPILQPRRGLQARSLY